jgi:hypothetical protein
MLTTMLDKARRVYYWMLKFVTTQRWNTPHTRMVLLNVYVRTILQFGAPVWAPQYLHLSLASEHTVLKPVFVAQRRYIRSLLRMDARLHNVLLYAVSNQIPLQTTLMKLVWRYYKRLDPEEREADPTEAYPALNEVARWVA